jgi:E3 ubiquitin-protein ligase CCNP1IP1
LFTICCPPLQARAFPSVPSKNVNLYSSVNILPIERQSCLEFQQSTSISPATMDFTLRCNSLKCRKQLTESAVVTTCRWNSSNVRSVHTTANHSSSHVFCDQCTDALGLNAAAGNNRICPACQTSLDKPDDAAITLLQPTEDYKTSVLSGLNPSTIMECAARGLAFWSYQSTQEMYVGRYRSGSHALTSASIYQEYLAKTLTDKYSTLNVQMDKVINDANSELNILNQKLNSMSLITLCRSTADVWVRYAD